MSKLLKPTNDYIFGRIFGDNKDKDLLKDLLSAILPDIPIHHLEIRKQVHLNQKLIDNKLGRLDILATLNTGVIINIEMQMSDNHNTIDRSIFYGSGLYHDSLIKNQNFNEIPRTICIWLLNYNLFKEGPFHEVANLKRNYQNIVLTNKVEYHYIQLPKFKEKCKRISNKLEQWLTFIINEDLEEINNMDNKYIKQAKEKLEYLNGDDEVILYAELLEKWDRDEQAALAGARSEGISQGEKKKQIQIAKKMLEKQLDINLIIDLTGLTKEEIKKL